MRRTYWLQLVEGFTAAGMVAAGTFGLSLLLGLSTQAAAVAACAAWSSTLAAWSVRMLAEARARARQARRRRAAVAVAVGGVIQQSHRGPDGVLVIDRLQLHEVSLVQTPANGHTRGDQSGIVGFGWEPHPDGD